MIKENSLLKWIVLLPIIGVILSSFILTYSYIVNEQIKIKSTIDYEKKHLIESTKNDLKSKIDRISYIVDENYNYKLNQAKEEIKNLTYLGHKVIENVYNENRTLSNDEILLKVRDRLRDVRFFNDSSGYYFIYNLDGTCVLLPPKPDLEGYNLYYITDVVGKFIIKDLIDIVKEKDEGYDSWKWYKKDEDIMKTKLGYTKVFKPLDILITTAKYSEDFETDVTKETLKLLSTIRYENNSYIFALDKMGNVLIHPDSSLIGKNIANIIDDGQDLVNSILLDENITKGKFIEYKFNQNQKISFVKELPKLNWIIGTGVKKSFLDDQIKNKTDLMSTDLYKTIKQTIIISLLVTFIMAILLTFILSNLKKVLKRYQNEIHDKNFKLKQFNQQLKEKVELEVKKNIEKDRLIHQQSKLASMGEMIGNIAHQWRQPLSAISSTASALKVHNDLGILESKDVDKSVDMIMNSTQYLSQTIEDFRHFFRPDKEAEHFTIAEIIEQELKLIESLYTSLNIKIISKIEPDSIAYGYKNEFIQAILNILNNSKDVLLNQKEDNRYIFIDSFRKDGKVNLIIKDSGGGIPENIINKIFDPYFTTKFKSQGTGIGLYMTKQILESHMKGKIIVKNKEFLFEDKTLKGAEFRIILFLNLNK